MLSHEFLDTVRRVGGYLDSCLQRFVRDKSTVFAEARGVGLMRGLKCAVPNVSAITRLREAGLIVAPAADNVVRLLPPLIIDETHVDEACTMIETAAQALKRDHAA